MRYVEKCMQLSLDDTVYIWIWAAYYSLPSSFRGVLNRRYKIEIEQKRQEQKQKKTEYTESVTGTETAKTEYTETSNVIRESLGDRVEMDATVVRLILLLLMNRRISDASLLFFWLGASLERHAITMETRPLSWVWPCAFAA